MGKSHSSLTKICSNCGQRKPLNAFLQLAGSEGSTYGNICSTCRKTLAEAGEEQPKEKEEGTSSTTGFQIDSKSKVHEEIDKKLIYKQTEELYHKERDENAENQLNQEQKIQTIAREEKKHRQSYLEKRPFLDKSKKPLTREAAEQVFGGEQQLEKERQIDLTAPMLDTQIGKEKYKSSVFNQFKTWLGASAPIVSTTEQAIQKTSKTAEPVKKEDESLTDYVEKTWGPKSRR